MSVGDRIDKLWDRIRQGPTKPISTIPVPPDHVEVDTKGILAGPIVAQEHYFLVRVNEMFLHAGRQWFAEYNPMVFVASGFRYGTDDQTVPYVVGPGMLKEFGQEVPEGMVFGDTRVAGVHPYRGDGLDLLVVLYRIKQQDHARDLLRLVEKATGAVSFGTALPAYVKVGDVVLDGVESLLGLADVVPIAGHRHDIDPNAGDRLDSPSFFVLIAKEEKADELWVKGIRPRLHVGDSLAASEPYRAADFVLYSVVGTPARDDAESLPWFAPLWKRVVLEANQAKDDAWVNAKANMTVLYQELLLSADMTENHARQLFQDRKAMMKAIHEDAISVATLGAGEAEAAEEPSPVEGIRAGALEVLNM